MKNLIVTGRAAIVESGSTLELTPEQYRRRKHRLEVKDKKKGLYVALENMPFKQGEVFAYEGIMKKIPFADNVQDVDEFDKQLEELVTDPEKTSEDGQTLAEMLAVKIKVDIREWCLDNEIDLPFADPDFNLKNISKDDMIEAIENYMDMQDK